MKINRWKCIVTAKINDHVETKTVTLRVFSEVWFTSFESSSVRKSTVRTAVIVCLDMSRER